MEKVLTEEIKEKKELKDYVHSQEVLSEELKKQLNEHKQQIAAKENKLAEMKLVHAKALEKRNSEVSVFHFAWFFFYQMISNSILI